MFEPTTLPIAMSFSFLIAAIIEVASSGTLVPNATKVTEITLSETPKSLAMLTAESISRFAPKVRAAQETIIIIIAPIMFSSFSFGASSLTGSSVGDSVGFSFLPLYIDSSVNSTNNITNISPSLRVIRLSCAKVKNSSEQKIRKGTSIFTEVLFTAIGSISAVIPSIKPMFAMLEPTTLPMLISG